MRESQKANGKNWDLTTWFGVTAWRKLAEAVNEYVAKGNQVFVEGELRGKASDGTQNPCIWQGNDEPAGRRQPQPASSRRPARSSF